MSEIFDRHRTSLESFVEAFTVSEEQTGALFAIGCEIVGLDLFDRHTTLATMLPKLVRSYAIDAIETSGRDDKGAKKKDDEEFLARLAMAEIQSFEALGLGTDLRIMTPGIVGGGLTVEGSLVHLAAFTADAGNVESDSGSMARMRSRRKSYGRR